MPPPSATFDAIGTRWQVDTADDLDPAVLEAVVARTAGYDLIWSRFRDDSLVHRIGASRHGGAFPLPAEAGPLLALYRDLYECTDGAMSPLVGQTLADWGYDSAYSLRRARFISPVPRWEDAIAWDGTTLTTAGPVVLDIGAAGKGQLVDLVAAVLEEHGVTGYTIDASGDILHHAASALSVALEHPRDSTKAIGVATLASGALCASASNRRSWPTAGGTVHHILDATTGAPTTAVIATWATAATTMVADAMATALFFADPDRLAGSFEFEWALMRADGSVRVSTGFDGRMFP
ncbi:MAG: FAD:protein FMN transferase [Burkholderiaceae bacterium]|nr:FAD:protein FMN transferase [Microbacteriaceae bacterium]